MRPAITPRDLKRFIIDTLALEDIQPDDIDDDEPLFANGLGLDSIDGLELDIALRKEFPCDVLDDVPASGRHLVTVRSLVALLSTRVQR
jgi:acyl carrier protein